MAKAGWYGSPDLELRILFARAHADFKAWAKTRKLYSIQRNFKYGLVTWSLFSFDSFGTLWFLILKVLFQFCCCGKNSPNLILGTGDFCSDSDN